MYEVENKPRKGPVQWAIEEERPQIPSDVFLWSALGLLGIAVAFKLMNRNQQSLFIGQWVAPFLLFGIYNKMFKEGESDQVDKEMD